jgi:hypothetical protein
MMLVVSTGGSGGRSNTANVVNNEQENVKHNTREGSESGRT